jgi:hypothetical protein
MRTTFDLKVPFQGAYPPFNISPEKVFKALGKPTPIAGPEVKADFKHADHQVGVEKSCRGGT